MVIVALLVYSTSMTLAKLEPLVKELLQYLQIRTPWKISEGCIYLFVSVLKVAKHLFERKTIINSHAERLSASF